MSKVAIVILNWNGESYLRKFLPVLEKYTTSQDVEIIVADNASTDGSLALLATEFSQIRTIVLDRNYGFAGGYNRALEQVDAEYFVLLNSDVEVTPFWLEPLVDYLDSHSDVAACQPKVRAYYDTSLFEHAGACGGYIDKYGFPFCRGRMFGELEVDNGQYDDVKDIFWATGACLLVRSRVFREVGGFDDDFFAHMEEIDLCWRINNSGNRIVCVPQSVVYHVGGGTLNAESPFKTYLNFRNNQLMLFKNLPERDLRWVMCARFFFDYVAALQLLLSGKRKNAWSVYKARRDFKRMRPAFVQKRKQVMEGLHRSNQAVVYSGSVVFDFYLGGKKKYSDLKY